MSASQTVAEAPLRVSVATFDSAYLRVLPRCPRLELVQLAPPPVALHWRNSWQPACLLIGADVNAELSLKLLGRALEWGISAYLADGAVLDFAQLDQLQQAFARQGLRLQTGQPLRYRPMVESVRDALWQGQLGEPAILRLHEWSQTYRTYGIPPGWELQAIRQYADLICWLLQAVPETVWATRPILNPATETAACPVETLQFHAGGPGPAMVVCDLAHGLPEGDSYWSLSVIGSRGAAYADDHRNRHLLFGGGTARAVCTREGDWPLLRQLLALSAGAMNAANASDAGPAPGAAALTRAIELSLRTQRTVPLDLGGTR